MSSSTAIEGHSPRVLELVRSLEKGGRTVRILDGVTSLQQKGYTFTVASFYPPASWVQQRWPAVDKLVRVSSQEGVSPLMVSALLRLLRRERIDLIHAHSEDAYLYGSLAARLKGVPIVGTFHRSHDYSYEKRLSSRIWNALLSHQVAVSEDRRQAMLNLTGAPAERVSVIHGAVDMIRFRPVSAAQRVIVRQELNLCPDALVVLGIGHLGRIKGHDLSLRAFAALRDRFPTASLYIAGDGSEADRAESQHLIYELGLTGRAALLGQIHNPEAWMAACDIFLQPSREEAFGLVFAEAAAVGRPVLATRIGGIPEIVIDEQTGLLVPREDTTALTHALERLLSNTALRNEMGERARSHAEACFTLNLMADRYDALFRRLLKLA